jgi:hypothetical protein
MTPGLPDRAAELRAQLTDARHLCAALGLSEGAQPNGAGLLVRCTFHADRTPSMSVRPGPDGTLQVRCFGCGAGGDALTLIAGVSGLDAQRDFRRVLEIAADLAGTDLQMLTSTRPPPTPTPIRDYPPAAEVAALWEASSPVTHVTEVAGWLASRSLNVAVVERLDLARGIRSEMPLPSWARFQGRDWLEIGHRCLVPMFDEHGQMRSLRARRVVEGRSPKALPPAGFKMSRLVMADSAACRLLRDEHQAGPERVRVVVQEGEPDYLLRATAPRTPNPPAVFGVVAGSWTAEIASRIPDGSRVIIRTHEDEAGEKYAAAVVATLSGRCTLLRGRPEL